jgi:hypothetical protein
VAVLSETPGPVLSGFGARARMDLGHGARPEEAAEEALRALGSRRPTVRPGLLSKGLGWSLGLLPRGARVRVVGRITRGTASRATTGQARLRPGRSRRDILRRKGEALAVGRPCGSGRVVLCPDRRHERSCSCPGSAPFGVMG